MIMMMVVEAKGKKRGGGIVIKPKRPSLGQFYSYAFTKNTKNTISPRLIVVSLVEAGYF